MKVFTLILILSSVVFASGDKIPSTNEVPSLLPNSAKKNGELLEQTKGTLLKILKAKENGVKPDPKQLEKLRQLVKQTGPLLTPEQRKKFPIVDKSKLFSEAQLKKQFYFWAGLNAKEWKRPKGIRRLTVLFERLCLRLGLSSEEVTKKNTLTFDEYKKAMLFVPTKKG
jgi:hypothetical protein